MNYIQVYSKYVRFLCSLQPFCTISRRKNTSPFLFPFKKSSKIYITQSSGIVILLKAKHPIHMFVEFFAPTGRYVINKFQNRFGRQISNHCVDELIVFCFDVFSCGTKKKSSRALQHRRWRPVLDGMDGIFGCQQLHPRSLTIAPEKLHSQ